MGRSTTWKEGAALRRDARHTAVNDSPRGRSIPNKRDTKKWCRGKPGVEHKPEVMTYAESKRMDMSGFGRQFQGWLIRYCSVCGKELAHWFGRGDPPDWATAFSGSRR
jgi:hypothetical protein